MHRMRRALERMRLKSRLITRHSRKLLLPDPAQRLLARLDADGFAGEVRSVGFGLVFGQRVHSARVARADEEDVVGLEGHALSASNSVEIGDGDFANVEVGYFYSLGFGP